MAYIRRIPRVPFGAVVNTSPFSFKSVSGAAPMVAISGEPDFVDKAFVWGNNAAGVLGIGTITSQETSMSLTLRNATYDVRSDAGTQQLFLIDKATGNIYASGNGQNGGLGIGVNERKSSPTLVVGGRSYIDVTSHGSASFGIEESSGKIFSWGFGGWMGINQFGFGIINSPVEINGSRSYIAVDSGLATTYAIEGSTGHIYGWGGNGGLSIGFGFTSPAPWGTVETPTAILGTRSYTDISTGFNNTQVAIEGSTGNVYAWGFNESGQCGVGDIVNKTTPTLVLGGRSYKKVIVSGSLYVMALEANTGHIYAWGSNNGGQLGDGTGIFRSSPSLVVGGRSYSDIASGGSTSFAIEGSTGHMYAWGSQTISLTGEVLPISSPTIVVRPSV